MVEGDEGTNKRPRLEKTAVVSASAPSSLVKVGQEELVSYLRYIVTAADLNDDSSDLRTHGYRLAHELAERRDWSSLFLWSTKLRPVQATRSLRSSKGSASCRTK
ncbi:integrin alpha-5 [Striga asiatica]|uniref:Integrin alpha-5 n=1 Tax=Striga asiatica TaxID=4170 RepID=A0A5A7PWS7_STRAF|nr:integrin alpha-5 [Striga asiatica]